LTEKKGLGKITGWQHDVSIGPPGGRGIFRRKWVKDNLQLRRGWGELNRKHETGGVREKNYQSVKQKENRQTHKDGGRGMPGAGKVQIRLKPWQIRTSALGKSVEGRPRSNGTEQQFRRGEGRGTTY